MPKGPSGSGFRSPASKKLVGSPHFTRQCSMHALFSSSAHYSERYQRCSQFEDMINRQDELKAAVTSSRSRSVRDGSSSDKYQFNWTCYSSSQTFSSRSSPSQYPLLGRLVIIHHHLPHHGHHSVDRRSSAILPMSPHHPLSHTANALWTARTPHILWRTYRGLLPPGTWQLQLAAQRCAHSRLLVPSPPINDDIQTDIESSRSRCAVRLSLLFLHHDWSPSIYWCVSLVVSTPILQLTRKKNPQTEPPCRFDLPRLALHTRA